MRQDARLEPRASQEEASGRADAARRRARGGDRRVADLQAATSGVPTSTPYSAGRRPGSARCPAGLAFGTGALAGRRPAAAPFRRYGAHELESVAGPDPAAQGAMLAERVAGGSIGTRAAAPLLDALAPAALRGARRGRLRPNPGERGSRWLLRRRSCRLLVIRLGGCTVHRARRRAARTTLPARGSVSRLRLRERPSLAAYGAGASGRRHVGCRYLDCAAGLGARKLAATSAAGAGDAGADAPAARWCDRRRFRGLGLHACARIRRLTAVRASPDCQARRTSAPQYPSGAGLGSAWQRRRPRARATC